MSSVRKKQFSLPSQKSQRIRSLNRVQSPWFQLWVLVCARIRGLPQPCLIRLANNSINIQLVSTSEIKISVGIARDSAEEATRLIHSAFGLDA